MRRHFNAALGEINMIYPNDARNSLLTVVKILIFMLIRLEPTKAMLNAVRLFLSSHTGLAAITLQGHKVAMNRGGSLSVYQLP
ncbi:MAG: hypothetical protein V2B19_25395 [Pseudomonadota bacterium]